AVYAVTADTLLPVIRCSFQLALGRVVGTAPTPGGEEGWPGRPQRRCQQIRSLASRCQRQQMFSRPHRVAARHAMSTDTCRRILLRICLPVDQTVDRGPWL